MKPKEALNKPSMNRVADKIALMSALLLMAGNAMASIEMPPAAQKFQCSICHEIDRKVIGPSWMDVSRFYNGKMEKTPTGKTLNEATGGKAPEEWLVTKVSKGGYGNWGNQPMLANDNVFHQTSPEKQPDIRTLVKFILSLAK